MGYKINLDTKIIINVENTNFKKITLIFLSSLKDLFEEFVTKVLLYYFEKYYENGRLPEMLGVLQVKKKTTRTRTKFITLFGTISVPQIQVRIIDFSGTEHQMSITRQLLGITRQFRIPDFMKEIIGWLGAVSSYRVAYNTLRILTNLKCSLMSVWRSVQWSAKKIKLKLHKDGTNEFEGDGTGIPTKKSGKRGSELKKIFQKKRDGKLHLVGLSIGKYKDKNDWLSAMSELMTALNSGLKKYAKIILSSDGDWSIINTARNISKRIKIQKDKWHIFHQLKYYLWKDGVKKEFKNKIIRHFFKITMLSKRSIKLRNERIKRYIFLLSCMGYKSVATYLQSSMDGFYTHETEGNTNIYTTKTERSMRTTNQRINVGIWSDAGALNVCKIRGAYYYNGISPLNWKKEV